MRKYDIVVIGGGPAGMVTAMTVRREHSDKSVLMIKSESKGLVPCGIPYVFHELGNIDKNRMGPEPFVDIGGEVLIDRVEKVDVNQRVIAVSSGDEIGFDKLVFATGSRPVQPDFLPGHDLKEGVGYVSKSYEGIIKLKKQTDQASKIIVLGSGFTAVEMAEQLAQEPDKEVHLVYRAEHCLQRSFSPEIAARIDKAVADAGVKLCSECQVAEITDDNGKADGVRLKDGLTMDADMVVVGMGYTPCGELADEAGIKVNKRGAVVVDNYLRTSEEDIYAVGDCAQTIDFITGREKGIMLASTAAAEARILGYNLYSMRIKRNFPGTLSVFSTELGGIGFASAGVIEADAKAMGLSALIGRFQDIDRHPGTLSGVSQIGAKLIVSPGDGQIIGCELYGGKSVGEMVNTVAMVIQKNVTVFELISFQLGTHPLLTTAPTKPILIKAAEDVIAQMK
ncbi:MAG: FAD-dependent oxidoreductase [Kiritimatiellia bacterium]